MTGFLKGNGSTLEAVADAGGGISGPASSTEKGVPRWANEDGDELEDTGVEIDDDDNISANNITEYPSGAMSLMSDADQKILIFPDTGTLAYGHNTLADIYFPANSRAFITVKLIGRYGQMCKRSWGVSRLTNYYINGVFLNNNSSDRTPYEDHHYPTSGSAHIRVMLDYAHSATLDDAYIRLRAWASAEHAASWYIELFGYGVEESDVVLA